MAVEKEQQPTNKDVPVKDYTKMTDKELMQAILNAGSSSNSGTQGGTK